MSRQDYYGYRGHGYHQEDTSDTGYDDTSDYEEISTSYDDVAPEDVAPDDSASAYHPGERFKRPGAGALEAPRQHRKQHYRPHTPAPANVAEEWHYGRGGFWNYPEYDDPYAPTGGRHYAPPSTAPGGGYGSNYRQAVVSNGYYSNGYQPHPFPTNVPPQGYTGYEMNPYNHRSPPQGGYYPGVPYGAPHHPIMGLVQPPAPPPATEHPGQSRTPGPVVKAEPTPEMLVMQMRLEEMEEDRKKREKEAEDQRIREQMKREAEEEAKRKQEEARLATIERQNAEAAARKQAEADLMKRMAEDAEREKKRREEHEAALQRAREEEKARLEEQRKADEVRKKLEEERIKKMEELAEKKLQEQLKEIERTKRKLEEQARQEAEFKARVEADAKAKAEKAARDKIEAELKAAEEERKRLEELEAFRKRAEQEAKMKAEKAMQEKLEASRKAAEAKAAEEAERAQFKKRMEEEAKLKAELAARQKLEQEAEAKAAANKKAADDEAWKTKVEKEAQQAAEIKAQKAKAEAEEKAKEAAEEATAAKKAKDEERKRIAEDAVRKEKEKAKPPIQFKDAVGRKFTLPFDLCRTWQGMEELVKQAFHHLPLIESQVQNGQYDLIGPDGEVILPKVWEKTIQPDWTITMELWPMGDRYNTASNAGPGPTMNRGGMPQYVPISKHRTNIPAHQPGPGPDFRPPGPSTGGIPPPRGIPIPIRPAHVPPVGTSGMRPGMPGPPAGMEGAPAGVGGPVAQVIEVMPPKEKKRTTKPSAHMRSFFAGKPIASKRKKYAMGHRILKEPEGR